ELPRTVPSLGDWEAQTSQGVDEIQTMIGGTGNGPPIERRRLVPDELVEASHCFVAEAAGVLWGGALDRISYVSRESRASNTIDLRAGQKSTLRDGVGVAVTLFSDVAIRFDRSLGPRVILWTPLLPSSNAPPEAIGQSVFSGQPLYLFDTQLAGKSH